MLEIREAVISLPSYVAEQISRIFTDAIETIVSFPGKVKDYITDLRDKLLNKLVSVIEGIEATPQKIIDGIASIFLPKDGFIEGKIDYFRQRLLAMGVDTYDMGEIFNTEKPFEDITCTVRGQTVTVVSMDIVDLVVKKFRPVIRGFMWLMLVFYNFNQFMGLIGQPGVTLGGIIETVSGKDGKYGN